jgi:uncharacterized protein (TIGR02147 family)
MEHVQLVASVAETISKYLKLNPNLARAIALGHDIGHAPFGHHGETVLQDIAEANKIRVVDGDAFTYFESWKNPVLRELVAMMPGATPEDVAEMCWQPITADEVRKSLDFMVSVGILQRKSKNVYVQTDKALVGNSEVMPLVVRSMHREMAGFAQKAIDEYDIHERDVSGVTMGIDRETYEQIVRELDSCRRKIVAIANMSKEPCQVYRLNLQMFPLSKNTHKNNEG